LDKYGFKATFSIVCNYVGNGDNRMTWEEIKSLRQEGNEKLPTKAMVMTKDARRVNSLFTWSRLEYNISCVRI
jgi:hypothetical protein